MNLRRECGFFRRLAAILLAPMVCWCWTAQAGEGDLDPSFGDGRGWHEWAADPVQGASVATLDEILALLQQADGKIVSAGFIHTNHLEPEHFVGIVRHNPDGSLDTSFNGTGMLSLRLGIQFDVADIIQQADGKLVLAGNCLDLYGSSNVCVVRLKENGQLDRRFGDAGVLHISLSPIPGGQAYAGSLLQLDNGSLLLIGGYDIYTDETYYNQENGFFLSRLQPDGVPDDSFGAGGLVKMADIIFGVSAAVEHADGRLSMAGQMGYGPLMASGSAIMRLTASGALDTSFHGTGIFLDDEVSRGAYTALDLQGDGKLVAAGYAAFADAEGNITTIHNKDLFVRRFESDGDLDTTFNGTGTFHIDLSGDRTWFCNGSGGDICGASDGATGLVQDAAGNWIVTGGYYAGSGVGASILLRLTPGGQLDTSFAGDGIAEIDFGSNKFESALDTLVQPDGKMVVGGHVTSAPTWSGGEDFFLRRFNVDGTVDTTFAEAGDRFTDFSYYLQGQGIKAMVRQPDGKLVTAGWTTVAGKAVCHVVRHNEDGSLDMSFNGVGSLVEPDVSSEVARLFLQPDNALVVVTYDTILRYLPDGTLDAAFADAGKLPWAYGAVAAAQQPDGKLLLSYTNGYDTGLGYGLVLRRLNLDGSLDQEFFYSWWDAGRAMVFQPDGKLLQIGQGKLRRINSNMTVDASFSSDGEVDLASLLPVPMGTEVYLHEMLVQQDQDIVVAGLFYDNTLRLKLALWRVNPDGTLDSGFGTGGWVIVDEGVRWHDITGMAELPGKKLLVAGTLDDGTGREPGLVRIKQNGDPDHAFGVNGVLPVRLGNSSGNQYLYSLFLQADGKLLIAGEKNAEEGVPGGGLLYGAAQSSGSTPETRGYLARLLLSVDTDGDGITDDLDAFPLDPLESLDSDNDGVGNNADLDDDNDSVPDYIDASPLDAGVSTENVLPLDAPYRGVIIREYTDQE